jgi:hypothetical protein
MEKICADLFLAGWSGGVTFIKDRHTAVGDKRNWSVPLAAAVNGREKTGR